MNKNFFIIILMIFAMIGWGETWVSAKILNRYLNSDELIFWRFLFTTIGMVIILFIFKISPKESLKELIIALITSIFLTLYNAFFFFGTRHSLASFGGIFVTTLTPIITFFLVTLFNKNSLHYKELLGLFIGIIGAIFMLKLWNFNLKEIFSLGNIYFILAAFTWSIITLISSKGKMKTPILFSFYIFLFTTILDLIHLDFKINNIFKFDNIFWLNLFLLSLWGTTFSTTIYFLAISKLGSKIASSFFFMVPLSALIFSIIFLKEKFDIYLTIGGVLGLIAIYFLNSSKKDFIIKRENNG